MEKAHTHTHTSHSQLSIPLRKTLLHRRGKRARRFFGTTGGYFNERTQYFFLTGSAQVIKRFEVIDW